MVMAAGFGKRMQPLTNERPKPLVEFNGKPLIDHGLDRLRDAGIKSVVANVHYLPDQIEKHVAARTSPKVAISDERETLLDTGGGAKRALPQLGDTPFLVINSDSIWREGPTPLIGRLLRAWDTLKMDCLMSLAVTSNSMGYDGVGDFNMEANGRLSRREPGQSTPFVNMGVYIVKPEMFKNTPDGPFSMNLLWDRAMQSGTLFGLRHDGFWMHLGTPDALALAQTLVQNETS